MYTTGETKRRQSPAVAKSTINSQKSLNNTQKSNNSKPTVVKTTIRLTASKNKVIEYGVKNRNQQQQQQQQPSKSKYVVPINNNQVPVATRFIRRPNADLTNSKSMEPIKKSNLTSISSTKTISYVRGRTYNSELSYKKSANQRAVDSKQNNSAREIEPIDTIDMAIQTNEDEILNHALIVGDLKIMKPSKHILEEVEQIQKDLQTKKLLNATRKFEEHSKMEEEHLDDLQEFLDKSYITRKTRRVRNISLEEDRK